MAWQKSTPALIARFQGALPAHPELEPRSMFGYPCAFVRGNFFAGLHEERVVIRLPDGLERQVGLDDAAPFDPMGGRPMSGWFVIPAAVAGSDARLAALLASAFPLVHALPPKVKKAPAKKAPATKASVKKASVKTPAKKASTTKATTTAQKTSTKKTATKTAR